MAGVYAFCRFTDDLVDRNPRGPAAARLALDAWEGLAEAAYAGEIVGIPLLEEVMADLREAGAPFRYVRDLIEGMRMDLDAPEYADLESLDVYLYRAASVVGLWLTRLFGIERPWVLERAAGLGRAMQLTNILRDVGEDLGRGRLYLPLAVLERHGVTRAMLVDAAGSGRIAPGYAAAIEELLLEAEARYDEAFRAIPYLPRFYQRPVAVAAHVYRGIHDGIRGNGYDNLTRRAYTSGPLKLRLAGRALRDLRRAGRAWQPLDEPVGPPAGAGPTLESA